MSPLLVIWRGLGIYIGVRLVLMNAMELGAASERAAQAKARAIAHAIIDPIVEDQEHGV